MRGSSGTTSDSPRTIRWVGSVKLRLAAMAVVIVFLVAAVVWVKQSTWNRVREIQQEFAAVRTEGFFLGIHLQGSIWKLNGMLLRFQLSQDSAERDNFHRESRDLTDWIARTKTQLMTPEERDLASQVEKAFALYLANTLPLLEKGVRPVKRDSASLVYQQIVEKSEPLLQLCQRLVQCQDNALAQRFDASETTLGSLHHLMQFSTLLLLACTAAIAVLAYRVVVTPLQQKLSRTEQMVTRQEKLASLGTLAAGVAHEVRNPLTAIRFRLFSFKKELPEPFAQHEDLTVINGEIDRLERIVDDFLQFARPSDPQMVETSVGDILQKVHDLLKSTLERQEITLRLESPEPIKLKADPQQIQQVLINLVQNAADSIDQKGTITLRAIPGMGNLSGKASRVVTFEVTDTGKGIPPEVEQQIFDPFFSTKESGTGLGLPIAGRVAENHGGYIHYQSSLKRGTTFSLVLPRISDEPNAHPAH
ncbi:MAG TPA: ATP-binding protein [Clostridia bacterium]|nr:ATP-binding protein [Clostridia bacterium]